MAELKPCPFCGSEKILLEDVDGLGLFGVKCTECECCGPVSDCKYEAIDAWNKRS